jgi:hypothetical protein
VAMPLCAALSPASQAEALELEPPGLVPPPPRRPPSFSCWHVLSEYAPLPLPHSYLPPFISCPLCFLLPQVVLATNIAETSLTIDGIVYVVDSGLHKCKAYHAAR